MARSRIRRLSTLVMLVLLTTAGVAQAQFSVLYNFGSNNADPQRPDYAGIIAQGRDGHLYSTTPHGGLYNYGAVGTVFRITPAGELHRVYDIGKSKVGDYPSGGLTLGTDGNFYGTTNLGPNDEGIVFKITPGGKLTVLYAFTGGSDGEQPQAPPVEGTDGNFYGTTKWMGSTTCECGTVYKVTPSGTFTTLYQFDGPHGAVPVAPLVEATDGNFYGVTEGGGTYSYGVVFRITPSGKLTVLHNFDMTDGEGPVGPLVQGNDGNFYGTTSSGGASGYGVVFRMTPQGELTVLHSMNGTTDGWSTFAGLVQATDGNFYGANSYGGNSLNCGSYGCGTLFKITPGGTFSVLYNFDSTTGSLPVGMFQHTNGIVYGDTDSGGTGSQPPCHPGNCGVFYSWNAGLPPFVSLLPYSGKVGKTIEFLGQGFTGATGVSFNGTTATFAVKSDAYLTATVPSGATTGPVTVTTAAGTLTSNKSFRVK